MSEEQKDQVRVQYVRIYTHNGVYTSASYKAVFNKNIHYFHADL